MKYTRIDKITPFDEIYIHKDHRDWFVSQFRDSPTQGMFRPMSNFNPLFGFNIHFVTHIPKWRKRWIFPPDRWVEYEESDEAWARPVGFGREIETDEPAIFLVPFKPIFSFSSGYDYKAYPLLWSLS